MLEIIKKKIRKWPETINGEFFIEFYLTVAQYAVTAMLQEEDQMIYNRLELKDDQRI